MTLCPIETRLIEPKLLTQPERTWLNQYHSTVYKTLPPGSPAEKSWLRKATAAV
ncbi:MAG: M24 family metallopeptidase C-terminal domain-containing protein [Candidatus Eisenbacteria bacterium]|nr:M24 family metallopeptidase C-terminal domain-containing protein [Candidatus Eisenbacteria bacterium]